ncbi:hypothetical protein BGW41_003060 [Actinomortierella wolfii]|nr:hypothetical protein BGW41_003060 [Actinomortierella wolfii]
MSEENGDYSVHLGLGADEMEQQSGLPLDGETFLNFSDDRIHEQEPSELVASTANQDTLEATDHDAVVSAAATSNILGDGGIQADIGDLDWQDKVKEIARSALSNHGGVVNPDGLGAHTTELGTVTDPVVGFSSLMGNALLGDAHSATQAGSWETLNHGGYGSLMDMEITRSSPPEEHNHHAFITPNLIFPTQVPDQHTDVEQHGDGVAKEDKDEGKVNESGSPKVMGPPRNIPDKQNTSRKQSPSSSSSTGQAAAPQQPPQPTRKSGRARKPSALATLSEEYLQTITAPANQPILPERVTRSKKVYCYCKQPDDGEVMIQCDNCREWFHGACVNITDEDAERMDLSNEKFFCKTCEETLKAQAASTGGKTGLYLSLSNARDCALPTCVNEARLTSDYCSEECAIKGIELEASQSVNSGSQSSPSTPTPVSTPKPAMRSVVKKAVTRVKQPESPKVEQDTVRMTVAKGLTECLMIAVEADKSEPSDDDREKARQLALAIEKELYIFTATPGQAGVGKDYKAKYRSLFFNLKDKSNDSLRKRVLSGGLAPHDLVRLTPEELANPLLQSIAEEVRKRSIHDSVLTPEQQSFIKKNHKGEVTYVIGASVTSATEVDESSTTVPEEQASTENDGDDHEGSGEDGTRDSAHSGTSGGVKPTPPGSPVIEYSLDKLLAKIPSSKRSGESVLTGGLSHQEKRARLLEGSATPGYSRPRRDSRDQEESYLPREPSPYSPSPSPQSSPHLGSTTPPDSPPAFFLEEIEQMVQRKRARVDKDGNDLLPVWQGTLSMQLVGSVSVRAVQVGGRPITGRYAKPFLEMIAPGWMDILTRSISIDGRIPISAVNTYVGQQMQSTTKDVLLIEFLVDEDTKDPGMERRKAEFKKLFDYFYEKERNGVVPHKGKRVKDMYIVPVAAGRTPPPYFDSLLDSSRGEIETDCLFGVLIVNKPSDDHRHHRHSQHQPSSRKDHGSNSSHGHGRNEPHSLHSSRHENVGHGPGIPPHREPLPPNPVPPSTMPPSVPHTPPVPAPGTPPVVAAVSSAPVPPPGTVPATPMRPVPSLQELQGLVNQLFPPQSSKPSGSPQPPVMSQSPYQAPSYVLHPPVTHSPQPLTSLAATVPTPTTTPAGPTAAAAAVTAQLGETNAAALLASLPPGFLEQLKKQAPTAAPQPPQSKPPQQQPPATGMSGPPPPMPIPPPFLSGMPLPPFPPPPIPPPPHGLPIPPFPPGAPPPFPPHLAMMGLPPMPGPNQGAQGSGRAPDGGPNSHPLPPFPPLPHQGNVRGGTGGPGGSSGGGGPPRSPPRQDPRFHSQPGGHHRDRDRDRPPKRPGPDQGHYRRPPSGGGGGGGGGGHGQQRKREWS